MLEWMLKEMLGCTFGIDGRIIVIVKQNFSISLSDALEHELRHVNAGDLNLSSI
jgi:hypothetical protein